MTLDLRCVLLNAENLFLLLDQRPTKSFDQILEPEWKQYSTSVYPNKSLSKLLKLKEYINEINPDVILLCEVGGEESLRNFNQIFLSDDYRVALIEGNSDRSIDIGYLIHKRVPYHFNIISNKDLPINFWYEHELQIPNTPSHKFSRDVAELHLFDRNINKPFFIFLLVHLKSPLDPEGIDPLGLSRREAELKCLLTIYHKLQKQYPSVPMAVCGDFNGNASRHGTDNEFRELYQATDLEDVLELINKPLPERVTFYPLRGGNILAGKQIDYVLLSDGAKGLLDHASSSVFRYEILTKGRAIGPQTLEEKQSLPADHYPIVFQLKNIPVIPKS